MKDEKELLDDVSRLEEAPTTAIVVEVVVVLFAVAVAMSGTVVDHYSLPDSIGDDGIQYIPTKYNLAELKTNSTTVTVLNSNQTEDENQWSLFQNKIHDIKTDLRKVGHYLYIKRETIFTYDKYPFIL